MTLFELDSDKLDTGTFEVLNDEPFEERVECWTDGTWIRLGQDVKEGTCIEFNINDYDDTIKRIPQITGAERLRLNVEKGGSRTFYVLNDDPTTIVDGRTPVLILTNDNYLRQAHNLAKEERDDFNAEDITRSFVESLRDFPEDITCERLGLTNRVQVNYTPTEILNVNINLLDELRNHDAIHEDDVSVSFKRTDTADDDPLVRYDFTVDAKQLPVGDTIDTGGDA